ncbi:helix-turn-helix domain-containing protein [Microbacterium sp. RD1]|uniref:helix-turn-helix domain-containing protein n=1 Tax=Microbacterium sp. RD1 TaxID=3457313 RepID=UPI003FA554F9
MQGLMVKLLNVDTPGERALRVVAYFDQLAANNPDLDVVVRATAIIADCPAGLELTSRGVLSRYSAEGIALPGPAASVSQRGTVVVDANEQGTVWLERAGETLELDEFIVERFGLTVAGVVAKQRPPSDADLAFGFSDPALAQLMVNGRASEAERSRAARLIGLHPTSPVQLIALEPRVGEQPDALIAAMRAAWRRPVYLAALSRQLSLVIAVGSDPVEWNVEGLAGRAASGPVVDLLDAPSSWAVARDALRFAGAASPWPRVLDAEQLGVVRLLGLLDPSVVAAHPDVARLEQLAAAPHGAEAIAILDHYLHADSLRSAARAANFHHSSLQSRIVRIGEALQVDLRTPAGRQRVALALILWRITRRDQS